MNIEELRTYCLSKPGTTECFPFDESTLVFKVGTTDKSKMFALCALDRHPLSINLKCDPDKAIELREHYDSIVPGYHMSKAHWNTIILEREVGDMLLKELIDVSYTIVRDSLPKKVRDTIN